MTSKKGETIINESDLRSSQNFWGAFILFSGCFHTYTYYFFFNYFLHWIFKNKTKRYISILYFKDKVDIVALCKEDYLLLIL